MEGWSPGAAFDTTTGVSGATLCHLRVDLPPSSAPSPPRIRIRFAPSHRVTNLRCTTNDVRYAVPLYHVAPEGGGGQLEWGDPSAVPKGTGSVSWHWTYVAVLDTSPASIPVPSISLPLDQLDIHSTDALGRHWALAPHAHIVSIPTYTENKEHISSLPPDTPLVLLPSTVFAGQAQPWQASRRRQAVSLTLFMVLLTTIVVWISDAVFVRPAILELQHRVEILSQATNFDDGFRSSWFEILSPESPTTSSEPSTASSTSILQLEHNLYASTELPSSPPASSPVSSPTEPTPPFAKSDPALPPLSPPSPLDAKADSRSPPERDDFANYSRRSIETSLIVHSEAGMGLAARPQNWIRSVLEVLCAPLGYYLGALASILGRMAPGPGPEH